MNETRNVKTEASAVIQIAISGLFLNGTFEDHPAALTHVSTRRGSVAESPSSYNHGDFFEIVETQWSDRRDLHAVRSAWQG